MKPYYQDERVTLINNDCLLALREMPDRSVQTCVTSPPYFGLRDYGCDDQIGLEETPDAYVAKMVEVFREVRRVLRDDGTLWLNLGDSYAGGKQGRADAHEMASSGGIANKRQHNEMGHQKWVDVEPKQRPVPNGFKPKDLVGIPWLVAKALQQPYYTGRISKEADRAWLAGFLDGEGTISYVERDRGDDHTPTHDVRVFFTNCDREPLDHFAALTAGHVYQHDGERENRYGSRPCFRWQMGTHDGALLLRELYPHLRTKRKQAALVWTLYTTLRHKNGHARTPTEIVEKRRAIAGLVRRLNAGEQADLPDWIEEPTPCYEPGWWLRQDIIWHKINPMPESVTDRCTKAHEYIFLLAKSARYYYDAEAVREESKPWILKRKDGMTAANKCDKDRVSGKPNKATKFYDELKGANRRSVWTVATKPYSGAHFATFPEELIIPCILAGAPKDGVVLDPFFGAGTTGLVAKNNSRKAIGIELNEKYCEMAAKRLQQEVLW